jgi:hypothetical protein
MNMTAFPDERRQHERFAVESVVLFSDARSPHTRKMEFSRDISMGGICIESTGLFSIGSKLIISFPTEADQRIEGLVRWTSKRGVLHRMGIEFSNCTEGHKECIAAMVGQHSR